MAQETNIVGKIPDFSSDDSIAEKGKEEVKETSTEEVVVVEKETPEPPAEKPDSKAIEDTKEPLQIENTTELEKAITGLQEERVKLLKEISELKGQRREIKQDRLQVVDKQIDELKDLHPDDVTTIERVLRSKGYMTKEESQRMWYQAVQQEELEKFLEKYPEYKPENDPNNANWSSLEREIGIYRTPENPRLWKELLERAHKGVTKVPRDRSITPEVIRKKQIETASVGGGGAQRSSPSVTTLDPMKRAALIQGGWSEEEIKLIEKRLSEKE